MSTTASPLRWPESTATATRLPTGRRRELRPAAPMLVGRVPLASGLPAAVRCCGSSPAAGAGGAPTTATCPHALANARCLPNAAPSNGLPQLGQALLMASPFWRHADGSTRRHESGAFWGVPGLSSPHVDRPHGGGLVPAAGDSRRRDDRPPAVPVGTPAGPGCAAPPTRSSAGARRCSTRCRPLVPSGHRPRRGRLRRRRHASGERRRLPGRGGAVVFATSTTSTTRRRARGGRTSCA